MIKQIVSVQIITSKNLEELQDKTNDFLTILTDRRDLININFSIVYFDDMVESYINQITYVSWNS